MKKHHQQGVALLEALLATVILAIGLLGTIGLQARALSALAQADMRAEATIASEKLLGIMANDQGGPSQTNLLLYRVAPNGTPAAPLAAWHAETRAMMPGASITVAVVLDSPGLTRVDITISWVRKAGDTPNQHRLTSYIAVS